MSDVDEDVDIDNQATFIVPCSDRAKARSDAVDEFPPLFTFEEDLRASEIRCKAFKESVRRLEAAFERMYAAIFAASFEQIESKLFPDEADDIPVPIYGKRLKVVLLPQNALISSHLSDNIRSTVEQRQGGLWVQLRARECLDHASTLRLLVTRALLQRPDVLDDSDLTDPLSLSYLGSDSTVCIFIDSLATFHFGVLNDLLQALHALADDDGAPTYKIIVHAENGQETLDDKIDSATNLLLDIDNVKLASSNSCFEMLIEEIFINTGTEESLPIWPSGTTLNMLQHQYYEYWPDLDKVKADITVALHNHFTRRPMSALCKATNDKSLWTPAMLTRIRSCIVSDDFKGISSHETVRLPVPLEDPNRSQKSQQQYLLSLLTDDKVLLSSLSSFREGVIDRRGKFIAGIQIAHLLRSSLGLDADKAEHEDESSAPRKSTLGGLFLALSSPSEQRVVVQDLRSAVRGRPLTVLKTILEEIETYEITQDEEQRKVYTDFKSQINELSDPSDAHAEEASLSEESRFDRVQRNLVREESSTQLKRQIGDWLIKLLRSLLQPSAPLEEEIWTTNSNLDSLSAMLCPAPRANVLVALRDPGAYLEDGGKRVPDVSIAYQTYQDAGRMINLADWFNAFRLSVEAQAKQRIAEITMPQANGHKSSSKRRRSGSESSELSELDDEMQEAEERKSKRHKSTDVRSEKDLATWNKAEMVRVRFALAVLELGSMGFLKRTRRKPEHILKMIFDLPPTRR